MDQLTAIVQAINSYLWGVTGLIPLLVGVGIFYTFKLKFVQIRKFGQAMRFTFRGLSLHGERAGKEGMTSFQSLATAVAAQVGTGNIAGAATAIAMGGPGAIFWMWIAAFFGMATIFAEAVLAQLFKTKDDKGHVTGGPAYYITNGLHCRPLAIFFSISIIIALGFIGNMVQSNSIAVAFQNAFGIPSLYTGLFVAGFAAFIFFGGLGRIASTTEKIVPVMAFLYILGSLIVILSNYEQIIPAFKMIFVGAFNPSAFTGGVVGSFFLSMNSSHSLRQLLIQENIITVFRQHRRNLCFQRHHFVIGICFCQSKEHTAHTSQNLPAVVQRHNRIFETRFLRIFHNSLDFFILLFNTFQESRLIMFHLDTVKVRCSIRGFKLRQERIARVCRLLPAGTYHTTHSCCKN